MKGRVGALFLIGTLILAPRLAAGQRPSVVRRLETEVWARIAERARQVGGFRLDSSNVDVRLPLHGEPEEIVGATVNAATALAVASAHVEPLDSIGRDATFSNARYTIRLEDRRGNCLVVHQRVTFDSTLRRMARMTEACRPLYMAEVMRRARLLARLPLSAGDVNDNWSIAGAVQGFADVYMDSVVILATRITLRSSYPIPDTAAIRVDSVTVGLGSGDERSWSIARRGAAASVDTVLRLGDTWSRDSLRFTIPLDSAFVLADSWPVLEVRLRIASSADNPDGLAWTYAHAPKPFFTLPLKPATPR